MYPGLQTRGVLAGFALLNADQNQDFFSSAFWIRPATEMCAKKERKKINEIDRGDSVV